VLLLALVAGAATWGPRVRARLTRKTDDTSPRPSTRVKYALFTAIVCMALSTGFGWLGVRLATQSPTFGLRWTGVLGASMTPLRASALEAAQKLLELELVRVFPEDNVIQYYRAPVGRGAPEAARYAELSRLRRECEKSPETLSAIAIVHSDVTEVAAERSLECQRPLDLSRMAEARFWEGDLTSASSLFDRAKVVWGETDKDQPFAQNLVIMRSKKEIFTHWLAGRFDRAGSAIDRLPEEHRTRFECTRRVMAVVANEPDALAKLEEKSEKCPIHLASVAPSQRKRLLSANEKEHDHYLYQSWAMALDPVLAPDTTYGEASKVSSPTRLEAPHEILSFPTSARRLDPAIVFELLAKVETDESPTPPRRLIRARLAVSAAITESLLGEHVASRRLVKLARTDFSALTALPSGTGDSPVEPSSYQREQLELESRYAAILDAAVELRAGNVERAGSVVTAIPPLVVDPKKSALLDSEVGRLAASAELVKAFVQLARGSEDDLRKFVSSEACALLSGCFIVKNDLDDLRAAARGVVASCEETECLIAARRPGTRDALVARIDDIAGMAAVSDEPLARLYRIGQVRALAHAIGETERAARFDRWYQATRPVALDPRLAVARRNLESIN
jgi:hypothetical protein